MLSFGVLFAQHNENKSWCNLNCEYTKQDSATADLLFLRVKNDSILDLSVRDSIKRFPIRFGIVQKDTLDISLSEIELLTVIDNLNYSFKEANFLFYLERVDIIKSDIYLEDLSNNHFNLYDTFSAQNDLDNMITIFVLDHKSDFCTVKGQILNCGRTGGFSYILSSRSNNVVISKFDILDAKIVAHEFGHFFGLFHTFEENLFGKDDFNKKDCYAQGDRICDTPPDPGSFYEVYVNYTTCEMSGFSDKNGNEYKPLLENYMSYYKPCYLKEYSFTPQQILVMQVASTLDIRKSLTK